MSERLLRRSEYTGLRVGVPVLGGICLTALIGALLPTDLMTRWVVHPALLAGLCWGGQFWVVARRIERPWPAVLGLANAVTLLRGGCYAAVAAFVVIPPSADLIWVPALCYGAGAALDRLDGTVARSVGEETALGERLDMGFDSFGFVVAPLVAVLWGRLPAWYLALSAARYVYLAGRHWRLRRGKAVFDSPDSDLGKYMAGVQMGFLTAALAPVVPNALVWTVAPVPLGASLAVFLRDYLVISGRLPLDRGQD